MFASLLIANRGEIACRIQRTARRMGLRCIAVYSDADAQAPHVLLSDEAHRLGPAPARESYLNVEALLEAAARSGAEAVHPGYGFLSENAGFAEACARAGLVFVGPPPAAIRAMGSKSEAKTIMEKAGVPLVPGYHGSDQAQDLLAAQAQRIGYPVLIKASAGGGGKGMRVVERPDDFEAALTSAKREASASFADDRVLIEKYLTKPRHIELQVFADSQGNVLHLGERDCSIQRRHQKVIEEAPAPGMTPERRLEMGEAAKAAAAAIGYVGAGTVEFIAEGEDFFFMEMNTRLQVEHPVTEMITGQDLVEWQLKVAAGELLPLTQEEVRLTGHAFEVRLYAEDPARDFLPATGRLTHLRFPEESPHLRVDAGVGEGDEISVHYDPMIAKLIVWDSTRAAALRRLSGALALTEVVGTTTNLAFLQRLAAHSAFADADFDTGFIGKHAEALQPERSAASDDLLALACLAELLARAQEARRAAAASSDPHSPWWSTDGWRLNAGTHRRLIFDDGAGDEGGGPRAAVVHYLPDGLYEIELEGRVIEARAQLREPRADGGGRIEANLAGRRLVATAVWQGRELTLLSDGGAHHLTLFDQLAAGEADETRDDRLVAPMPGKVVQVLVEAGAEVTAGQPLIVLEAMKMEHTLSAPADGRIAALRYAAGDLVEEGVELLEFAPAVVEEAAS
ncbi:acetyl/propionyl/methylcrotonyl-CoA carboxylase subunit alpha [Algihabitans albus]|uniref:acetyl/propionyl/methylcrotonyl-CoA carboxylase subunit alpha n=1 Tax=Algihabitans albus TaxID=2164067 RepID=UPI000E5C9887|nr:acetyl/propionyl/methylcrotonyl-CoA carboxylase subunit alpha [Algihabitans albus]